MSGEPPLSARTGTGINFFDTADVYSLARVKRSWPRLKHFGRDRATRVVIATKCSRPMGRRSQPAGGLSRKHILPFDRRHLRRLGTDYGGLFYQSTVSRHSHPIEETLEALDHE